MAQVAATHLLSESVCGVEADIQARVEVELAAATGGAALNGIAVFRGEVLVNLDRDGVQWNHGHGQTEDRSSGYGEVHSAVGLLPAHAARFGIVAAAGKVYLRGALNGVPASAEFEHASAGIVDLNAPAAAAFAARHCDGDGVKGLPGESEVGLRLLAG